MVFVRFVLQRIKQKSFVKNLDILDKRILFHYNNLDFGVWRSLVSRLVRVQEASGSNPDTPTKIKRAALAALFILGRMRDARDRPPVHILG